MVSSARFCTLERTYHSFFIAFVCRNSAKSERIRQHIYKIRKCSLRFAGDLHVKRKSRIEEEIGETFCQSGNQVYLQQAICYIYSRNYRSCFWNYIKYKNEFRGFPYYFSCFLCFATYKCTVRYRDIFLVLHYDRLTSDLTGKRD